MSRSSALRLALVLASGCAAAGRAAAPLQAPDALAALDGARFVWVSSACVDGALPLGTQGFERTLRTQVVGRRLLLTYDTQLATALCASTEVVSAEPAAGGQWRFVTQARSALPHGTRCGPEAADEEIGRLGLSGETLQELRSASALCGGLPARSTYQRVPPAPRTTPELLRHYAAHFSRGDAAALCALFAEQGVLVEPFGRTEQAHPLRHAGRAAVRAWYDGAFATAPWGALELLEVELHADGRAVAQWRYMDPRLQDPLLGRNLFVTAGGEIFATEIQLLQAPKAR